MSKQLKDLYEGVSVHATADREHEAAVELLLLVMIADRHIDSDEIDEIRTISEDQGFETDTFSFDQYLGQAMAKVRAAVADDATEELLDDIDAPDHRVRCCVTRCSRQPATWPASTRHRPRRGEPARPGRRPLRLTQTWFRASGRRGTQQRSTSGSIVV